MPFSDDQIRHRLQELRNIALQMFHFVDDFDWLEESPDHWITQVMENLRPAAKELMDYDVVRKAFLKTGAACLAAIMEGDKLFLSNTGKDPFNPHFKDEE